jgi:hypothetical protein
VYTILDIFSEIGGIFEILHMLGMLIILPINKRAIKIDIVNQMMTLPTYIKKIKFNKSQKNKKVSRVYHLPLNNKTIDESKFDRLGQVQGVKGKKLDKMCKFTFLDLIWMMIPGSRCFSKTRIAKNSTLGQRINSFEELSNRFTSEVDCINIIRSI